MNRALPLPALALLSYLSLSPGLAQAPPAESPEPAPAAGVKALLEAASSLRQQKQPVEALASADGALAAALLAVDVPGEAAAQRERARALADAHKPNQSAGAWERAAAAWERAGDGPGRIEALCARAQLLLDAGQVLGHRLLEQAVDFAQAERRRPMAAALALDYAGYAFVGRGRLAEARLLRTADLGIRERLAPGGLPVARALNNLAVVVLEQSDPAGTRQLLERALDIQDRLSPGSIELSRTLSNLGLIARRQGDLAGARRHAERAVALKERLAPGSSDLALSLTNLGLIVHDQGDHTGAKQLFERALDIKSRVAPGSLELAPDLSNLGRLAQRAGDLKGARRLYLRALDIYARRAPASLDAARVLHNLASAAKEEGDLKGAKQFALGAVGILESQRRQVGSAEGRALLLNEFMEVYLGLVRAQLRTGELGEAFATVERSRARALTELLAERRLDFGSDVAPDLLRQQAALDDRRASAYAALARLPASTASSDLEKLRAEIDTVAFEQRELAAQARRRSPRYAALRYPQPLDLGSTRAALDPGTLLLTYLVDRRRTFLFVVAGGASSAGVAPVQVLELPVGEEELQQRVEEFRSAVIQQGAARRRGRDLYDQLLRPAKELVTAARRVLICPDGPLHRLPFAALVAGEQDGRPLYLADLKPLHTVVSATVYAELRKPTRAGAPEITLLAIGDPAYRSAPRAREASVEAGSGGAREPRFPPLPGARREVAAIAAVYGPAARVLLGEAATESAVKREAPAARYLHLACHGHLDSRDPLASFLALTPPRHHPTTTAPHHPTTSPSRQLTAPPAPNDGLLQAHEILSHLRLNADLVVLSACETGLGETTRHEGLVGLTRALQYAGARSIMVSLWSVADESTAALMAAVYRELRRGTSKDVALQRAMAAVRADPRWRHPFYWAPFTLTGDWR